MAIKCANCHETHPTVADVRECHVKSVQAANADRDPFDVFEDGPGWSAPAEPDRRDSYERASDAGARRMDGPAGRQRVPLSEKQRDYILSLSASRLSYWTGSEEQVAAVESLSKSEASVRIGELLKMPVIQKPKATAADRPNATEPSMPVKIPDGRYALTGPDGVVRFYQVQSGKGKWEGYTFVKGLIGSPGSWRQIKLGRMEREMVQSKIAADYMAALKLYGMKHKACGFCDSPLSDPRSRAAVYGEKCAANHFLPYPSLREALEILKERGEDISEYATA